jgi:hypothetical protein
MLGLPAAQSCEWSRYPSLLPVSADEIREPFCSQSVEDWSKYGGKASNDREQKAAFFFLKAQRLKGFEGTALAATPPRLPPPPFLQTGPSSVVCGRP